MQARRTDGLNAKFHCSLTHPGVNLVKLNCSNKHSMLTINYKYIGVLCLKVILNKEKTLSETDTNS
jgi:hypothetical protein